MRLGFLHTAAVHEVTFDRLLADMAPDATAQHVTRPDLLERARRGDTPVAALTAALAGLDHCDATLCTCSSLGALAEDLGALRIDRPLAEAAASYRAPLIAYCVASTRAPTEALMREAGIAAPDLLFCPGWEAFERGDMALYGRMIADAVAGSAAGYDAVVLAQASMACAAAQLSAIGLPVLTAPPLALGALLKRAHMM